MMFISSGETCRILSIPQRTLTNWVKAGIIKPAIDGVGSGNHRQFLAVPDVLAVALGRGLRCHGLTLQAAANAMEFIMGQSEAQLERAFAQGRHYLVMIGSEVAERLLSKDEISKSRPLRVAQQAGAPIITLDLGRLYRRLMAEVTEPAEPVEA